MSLYTPASRIVMEKWKHVVSWEKSELQEVHHEGKGLELERSPSGSILAGNVWYSPRGNGRSVFVSYYKGIKQTGTSNLRRPAVVRALPSCDLMRLQQPEREKSSGPAGEETLPSLSLSLLPSSPPPLFLPLLPLPLPLFHSPSLVLIAKPNRKQLI